MTVPDRISMSLAVAAGALSQLVVTLDMARRPGHMLRVVVLPLALLVLLTFTIFWMDRESLGDRMDISFIEAALGLIGADRSEPAQANGTFICVVEHLGVHI